MCVYIYFHSFKYGQKKDKELYFRTNGVHF
jgi:hypothetical protein